MQKNKDLHVAIEALIESQDKLKKKLEAIRKALPDEHILANWGSGPKTFVEKVRKEVKQ